MADRRAVADLLDGFDPALSLWRCPGPGHTRATRRCAEVHAARVTARRIHDLTARRSLDCLDASAVLRRLIVMQDRSGGDLHGCLRWYWQDPHIQDTNAGFFVGLPLLAMRLRFADQVPPAVIHLLDDLLGPMRVWFRNGVRAKHMHYPNKYLGDMVCAWLLREVFGSDDFTRELADHMEHAARYWREQHWGWGEHMSDIYSHVLLDQLVTLLLLGRSLPDGLRAQYRQLFEELIAIDDRFGAGPRVPAIRSYAFKRCGSRQPYRDRPAGNSPRAYDGWDELLPPSLPVPRDSRVACHGDAQAVARIYDDCRLGSISRYPLMRNIDQTTWGLCWQSFPVAFWRPRGDWGFLQFLTIQGDRVRAHPAIDRAIAYQDNALSMDRQPPIIGHTSCEQNGDMLRVRRILPAVSPQWDLTVDRFQLLHLDPAATVRSLHNGFSIVYAERTFRVTVDNAPGARVRLDQSTAGQLALSIEWSKKEITAPGGLKSQWSIRLI